MIPLCPILGTLRLPDPVAMSRIITNPDLDGVGMVPTESLAMTIVPLVMQVAFVIALAELIANA